MKIATTSERLKQVMSERNYRQIDIIEKCKPYAKKYNIKFGRNDLSQYVSGKVTPSQTKLTVLGLALNVSETWLMGYDVEKERERKDIFSYSNIRPIETRKIPMIGNIACGKPIMCEQEYDTFVETDADIRADVCMTCCGDSMIGARIFDGDIVFIHRQPMVNNGEIAAVIIDNEATLKRVYYYPEKHKLVLQAENPKYEPLVYMGEELNEIEIYGKAVFFQSNIK